MSPSIDFRSRPAPQPVEGRVGRHWLPGETHTGQIDARAVLAFREPTQLVATVDRTQIMTRPRRPNAAPFQQVPMPVPRPTEWPPRSPAVGQVAPIPYAELPAREKTTQRLVGASRRAITRLKLAANVGRWGRR